MCRQIVEVQGTDHDQEEDHEDQAPFQGSLDPVGFFPGPLAGLHAAGRLPHVPGSRAEIEGVGLFGHGHVSLF